MCKSLLDVIPRQAFSVALQAAVNGKIIARETMRHIEKMLLQNVMVEILQENVNYLSVKKR